MPWIILLLIIGLPVLELTVLIDVGEEVGAFNTVLLCLLTAAVGLSLVRLQGLTMLRNMQGALQSGAAVGESLIHGFFLLIAGIFLFIPGFITDSIGALLLVPPLRLLLGKIGFARVLVRQTNRHSPTSVTIDGEFQETHSDKTRFTEIPAESGKKPENTPEN